LITLSTLFSAIKQMVLPGRKKVRLSRAGVPLKADREESWRAFVSMRSQYGFVLVALAHLVSAPQAPWSSDRKLGLTTLDLDR